MELKNSPLVEAVFEVAFTHDFGEYDPTLPGLFYSEISEKFPTKKEIPNFKYELLDQDGTEKQVSATLSRFSDDNGNHIQLTKDFIVFNKIAPDVNWIKLKDNIVSNIEKFVRINNNNQVEYCALKYVNIIEAPLGENLKKYFNFNLPLPNDEEFTAIRHIDNSVEFDYKGALAKVDFKTISPTDKHARCLLEIAITKGKRFDFDTKFISEWLIESHKYICDIFFKSVNVEILETEANG